MPRATMLGWYFVELAIVGVEWFVAVVATLQP